MGMLDGKIALVFGLANKNSIAWGIIKKLHAEGATILLSYVGEIMEKRVMPLAEEIGCTFGGNRLHLRRTRRCEQR